jgi:hypothetical protein
MRVARVDGYDLEVSGKGRFRQATQQENVGKQRTLTDAGKGAFRIESPVRTLIREQVVARLKKGIRKNAY